jgi:hypothetical protein
MAPTEHEKGMKEQQSCHPLSEILAVINGLHLVSNYGSAKSQHHYSVGKQCNALSDLQRHHPIHYQAESHP